MSEAHTPGPWTCFYKSKYDEWHVSLPMAGGGMKLALCPDGIQSENREADARLIAAAPDLFESCDEAFDFLGGVDGASAIRSKLLAAILRANGGTQP